MIEDPFWRVKSYVLAKKGVLISNPDVRRMNPSQWMFEYHSLRRLEHEERKARYEDLRLLLVDVLGLNIGVVRDEEGQIILEPTQEQVAGNVRPLVLWMGNDRALAKYAEDVDEYRSLKSAVDSVGSDADYEAMVAAGPEALLNLDDDIMPMPDDVALDLFQSRLGPQSEEEPKQRKRVVVDEDG